MTVLALADLLAPGIGHPVAAVLKFICSAVDDMQESRELCARVCEQLVFIYNKMEAMEAKGTLPSDAILNKYSRVVGDYGVFLQKQQRRPWLYRVVTCKRVVEAAKSAQDVIGDLMSALSLCHMEAMGDERARMQQFREQQERLIEARLVSDAAIAKEVARQVQQIEALSVLRHELQTSSTKSKVVCVALDKVMRRSSVRVDSTPEWFLPAHKVEYEAQAFARGSFGSVHLGKMGVVEVVVKCLLLDTRWNDALTAKFRDEAQLWFRFRHKHILTMYGACDVSSPPYIVCEYAANSNLFNFLGKVKHRAFTFQLLLEAASGLLYLHDQRVVHADLKCDNILVAADGTAKIADFSFSYVRTMSASKASLTDPSSATRAGALRWRAPECLRARRPTAASDVFSFGMCIIEAVSLELPWGYHVDDDTVRDQVKSGELPDQPEDMSDRAWELVQRMCSFEPSERPTLQTVIQELSELAAAEAASRDPRTSARSTFYYDAPRVRPDPIDEKQSGRSAKAHPVPPIAEIADNQKAVVLAGPVRSAEPPQMKKKKEDDDDDDVEVTGHPSNQDTVKDDDDDNVSDETSALHHAAQHGRVGDLKHLLRQEVPVDSTNRSGETALIVAATAGQTEAARVLLRNNANASAKSRSRITALHRAAGGGHVDIIALLLQKGARVDDVTSNGHTPLYWAAWKGHAEAAALLLEHSADVDAKDNNGTSALHQAAIQGHADVIKALLGAGANVDRTAVRLAARHQHSEIVDILKPRVRSMLSLSRLFG